GLRKLVETVREASGGETRLFIQIIDFLAVKRRPEKEKYFQRFLKIDDQHRHALKELTSQSAWLSASDEHMRELPRELPPIFAAAAERAREAGFDGVELHYAHAYTMAGFLSAQNDRADGYGGSREFRARLPLEVYREVRNRVGADYVVGVRFLADEVIERGSRVEDAIFYAQEFARAGFDFLSLSKGGKFEDAQQPKVGQAVYPYTGQSGYECMPTVLSDARGPFGRSVPLVAAIKKAVNESGFNTPIVATGGISTFEQAEEILRLGQADIVGMARQALADPDWFMKVRLGRGEEVRRCTYTNYCEALDQAHKPVTCKLWDKGRRVLEPPPWLTTDDTD